jgi:hypothetical protein
LNKENFGKEYISTEEIAGSEGGRDILTMVIIGLREQGELIEPGVAVCSL